MPDESILGFGPISPFRRDKARDFAAAGGETLIRSAVQQVLGTACASDFTQGEIPWRTEFGSLLHLLRHQQNDVALQELAKVYVQDALRRWEPRVVVTDLRADRLDDSEGNKLVLRLRYNVIAKNMAGNEVLVDGVQQSVEVRS